MVRRAVAEARSAGGTVRRPAQDGPLDQKEDRVERAEEVPELDGAAEDRDRAGRAARRSQRQGRLPGARDLGHALLFVAGQAARGREALAGKDERKREGAAAQGGGDRTPTRRRRPPPRPAADPVERAIVAEALANQTDGYRMVTALVRRQLGRPVNRKRVLRVLRERKLIQRRRPLEGAGGPASPGSSGPGSCGSST